MAGKEQPKISRKKRDFASVLTGFSGSDDVQTKKGDAKFPYDYNWILGHLLGRRGANGRQAIDLGNINTFDDLFNKIQVWFQKEYDQRVVSHYDLLLLWSDQIKIWVDDHGISASRMTKHRTLRHICGQIMIELCVNGMRGKMPTLIDEEPVESNKSTPTKNSVDLNDDDTINEDDDDGQSVVSVDQQVARGDVINVSQFNLINESIKNLTKLVTANFAETKEKIITQASVK